MSLKKYAVPTHPLCSAGCSAAGGKLQNINVDNRINQI